MQGRGKVVGQGDASPAGCSSTLLFMGCSITKVRFGPLNVGELPDLPWLTVGGLETQETLPQRSVQPEK